MSNVTTTIVQLLGELSKGRPSKVFVRKLAKACWQDANAELGELRLTEVSEVVLKGSLSDEPAAIFCGHDQTRSIDLLHQVGLIAYHFSIEWGIITNKLDTLIFNSHWLRDGNFFRIPIDPSQGNSADANLLEFFTPQGLLDGKLESAAKAHASPDQLLLPVDDALVNQLDFWRSEAMRHANWSAGIDEAVQMLFSQLFILRAVEDRKLIPNMPTLDSTLSAHGELNLSLLEKRFEMARAEIQSELFDLQPARELPSFVVAGIIRELYRPRHLSALNARYNFQWIPADVLGRAYEKYLSNVLVPTRLPPRQARLFDEPLRDVEKVSIRKAGGVFYTPEYITRYLASRAISMEQKTTRLSNATVPRVGDISCGSGSFLTSALDLLLKRLRKQDPEINWGKRIIDQKRIVGIDIDGRAVTLARLSVWLRLTEEPNALPLPRLSECIVQGDSLGEKVWAKLPDSFDILLGNPPFLASASLQKKESLAQRFETAEGRFDYAFLFYEQALKRLRNGGALGMVTPNRLFTNRDAASARNYITSHTNLITIVDFGSLEVFAGISAYIGLLVGVKAENGRAPKTELRLISVRQLPARFAGVLLAVADSGTDEISSGQLRAFNVKQPEGRMPWTFLAPAEIGIRDKVARDAISLAEIAQCLQGIKTGCNEVFVVVPEQPANGELTRVTNRFGEQFEIETELLRPVVFGSDIQRYVPPDPSRLLIYTYRGGQVLSELELKHAYPKTFAYLDAYKPLLSQRRSITESPGNKAWYELIRERSTTWLEAPKLIMRDLATETSFALDFDGGVFLIGGTAVLPVDHHNLLPLMAFLNSKLANWYLKSVTPSFRASFQKFEPQHLEQLSVPGIVLRDELVRDELSKAARSVIKAAAIDDFKSRDEHSAAIDNILATAVGISLETLHSK